VLIGAHVRAGGKLVPALERGDDIGAEAVQIFTQSPRAWKPTQYAPSVLAGFRQAQAEHPRVRATYCHATYLINLASSDPALLARSRDCLAANLAAARGMGSSGLVLHIGSHQGAGLPKVLSQIVDCLAEAVETPPDGDGPVGEPGDCPILLENAAGAGGTVGRTLEELAEVLDRADAGPTLGVCLDTQHLWASGVDFSTLAGADAIVGAFDDAIGLDRLRCMHLNDSKVELGANRDRHENVGEGTIGSTGLGALLSHPSLAGLHAILEVPGDGGGPRKEDVEAAHEALKEGYALRA
jgi:deoxyribonuclease IV